MAYIYIYILTFYLTLSGIYSGILSGIHSEILSGIYSAILSGICSDILSGIYSGICSDILSGIYSDILSGIYWDVLSGIYSGILSGIYSGMLSGIYSDILSGIHSEILSGIYSDILFWHSLCSGPSPAHSVWNSRYEIRRRAGTEVDEKRAGEERSYTFVKIQRPTWQVGARTPIPNIRRITTCPRWVTNYNGLSSISAKKCKKSLDT